MTSWHFAKKKKTCDLDSQQNPKLLTYKSKTDFFLKVHVANVRAQHSYSNTMQNLVPLLLDSPEGLS